MHFNLKKKYDFIILGSGLGGLLTAFILSKAGNKVLILEKNPKLGGTLQSFRRFGCDFSTGMHYLGSLDEGQMLNKIFKYFNLFETIEYKKLDVDGFEVVNVAGTEYKIPMGWERYKKQFLEYFPGNEEVIERYYYLVNRAIDAQALYNLNHPEENNDDNILMKSAYEVLKSLSPDVGIQNFLAALNFDYVGEKDKTPFYVHALVSNYFIKSSYRVIGDSDQIANSLANSIREYGGEILNRQKVVGFLYEDKNITAVKTHKEEIFYGDRIISNIHPANTMDLIDNDRIKKIYRNRMKNMKNTISSFAVHLKMKENSFEYLNYNYQYFKQNDVWYPSYYDEKNWPEHFFLQTPPLKMEEDYCNCVQILTAMKYDEVKKWEGTTKRTRGEEYHRWKEEKAQKLINMVEEKFPGFKDKIENINISTPLSFKDYIGTTDGSMYGRISDFNNVVSNYVSHRTKIPNLYLTGQNLNLHGALGVSLSALITSGEFINLKNLLGEINNA
ncbi:MAG: all-trans-retinol 13,14-reductase [Marinilabiliales bacterium]|nr:MAG: all-trans-retinol 13,14-reductase [Marinilabiliales bacterium]